MDPVTQQALCLVRIKTLNNTPMLALDFKADKGFPRGHNRVRVLAITCESAESNFTSRL